MSQSSQIQAEMVASVLSVEVAVGDAIAPGDTVVMLESMKMEIPVLSEVHGTIGSVSVKAGDLVQEGDVLVVIDG